MLGDRKLIELMTLSVFYNSQLSGNTVLLMFFSASGFVGYSSEVLANNTDQDYSPGESFFTVFGVYFPTATGVFAGINMSGDLKNPMKSIPVGTLSAIGVRSVFPGYIVLFCFCVSIITMRCFLIFFSSCLCRKQITIYNDV